MKNLVYESATRVIRSNIKVIESEIESNNHALITSASASENVGAAAAVTKTDVKQEPLNQSFVSQGASTSAGSNNRKRKPNPKTNGACSSNKRVKIEGKNSAQKLSDHSKILINMQNCYSALCDLAGIPQENITILAKGLVANITNTIDKFPKKNNQKLEHKHPVKIWQVKPSMKGIDIVKQVHQYTCTLAYITGTPKIAAHELGDILQSNINKISANKPKKCRLNPNQGPGQ